MSRQEQGETIVRKCLDASNALTETIDGLPTELAIALSTGRGSLAKMLDRPLTTEESRAVANGWRVLIDTLSAHQEHAEFLAEEIRAARKTLEGFGRTLNRLEANARFQNDDDDDSEL